ncbi:MAG: hypothetical protein M0C28_14155 [Candidatus Moduliflexus flocculans]|nr:hypothetical protein [Candidatus Moduliflexus flocculans]
MIVRSGVVPRHRYRRLESEIARTTRWKDSWLPDAACLLAAVLLPLIGQQLPLSEATAVPDPDRVMAGLPLTVQWYWTACLTLIRFLILRWFWQLGLWWISSGACRGWSSSSCRLTPMALPGWAIWKWCRRISFQWYWRFR